MVREGKPEKSWRRVQEAVTAQLLEREDAARYDVPGAEYFHRAGEVLVSVARLDDLRHDLRDLQADETDRADELGIATFRLRGQVPVHDAALTLRKTAGDATAAAPHHLLFGVPKLRPCPGGPVIPGEDPQLLDPTGTAGEGVVIAVIDTGQAEQSLRGDWMRDHVDMGVDDVDLLDDPQDDELDLEAGHGTFIAGVIGQVAPGAKVLARKAIDSWGVTDDITVARAVHRALADGAHIINLSLGGYSMEDVPPLATASVLDPKRRLEQVVYVAAAGNDGLDRPFYPAALPHVIGVAALGSRRRRAVFSNFGPWVDASAEGERLLSTFVTGTVMSDSDGNGRKDVFKEPWAHWSGTSFAAPQVAAAIAARMSQTGESATEAAFALVGDPALPRRTGLGVQVRTNVHSHPARRGFP